MLSEALDIAIESREGDLWLILAGQFKKEQVESIRSKIEGFLKDDNNFIVIDMEKVTEIHESVPQMFLELLNLINGKEGSLKFVFKNNIVTQAFSPFKNIFEIYSDAASFSASGFIHNMKRQGIILSRKTGIRLSIPVAIFLLFIMVMWFLTLGYIIHMQTKEIRKQEQVITGYEEHNKMQQIEIEDLKEKLKPLEQLGILKDE